jgi:AcrR family transcriptional regulator
MKVPGTMATRTKAKPGSIYHQHRCEAATPHSRCGQTALRQAWDRSDHNGRGHGRERLRASTLYEYFSKKDDIVWAILTDMLEEGSARAKIVVDSATTGLAKIMALLGHMADQLSNDLAKVRFVAQFDAMYARDWPVERLLTLEGHFGDSGFEALKELIREGIADGSLRPDLDPDLTLHAVINAVIAAQRRLASLRPKVELEYGHSIDRLFRERFASSSLACAPPHPQTAMDRPRE